MTAFNKATQRTLMVAALGGAMASMVLAPPATANVAGPAATTLKYKNCTALRKRHPHGVGKFGAHDRTASGDPVTNFRRSNRLYRENQHLDRDKDGVACEA